MTATIIPLGKHEASPEWDRFARNAAIDRAVKATALRIAFGDTVDARFFVKVWAFAVGLIPATEIRHEFRKAAK